MWFDFFTYLGLGDRVALRDLLSEDNMGKVGGFVWHIITATLIVEIVGVILIHHFWQTTHEHSSRLWWDSIFHAVSAFCNAGFNITNYGDHGAGAFLVALGLMFVGGNLGGTAGGIKTTTFAICLMEVKLVVMPPTAVCC